MKKSSVADAIWQIMKEYIPLKTENQKLKEEILMHKTTIEYLESKVLK